MEKKVFIVSGQATAGPYSHAAEAGGFIFVSGTGPIDIENNIFEFDDVKKATKIVLENISKILIAAGSGLDRVVKANVYLRDMADFNAMNEVYTTYFPKDPPARTCIAAKQLPANIPVEIEVIALKQ
ncbi:MAG: RidA family protein [Chloroflexi bacterium]|nr:RidA family protein [Chloroflexota bacterium]